MPSNWVVPQERKLLSLYVGAKAFFIAIRTGKEEFLK